MLSQQTIEIVKSTVPVLAQKGNEITTVFYKNLFESHPELLNIFNVTNQQKGRQQNALANTVYAAAQYIDQLHVLLPAVKQIAHKNRSLVVKPEHYPIVGEYLLAAIKEVLGDAATEEILSAWGEAYGVIADVFISVEEEMYKEAGWEGYRQFTVSDKVKESDNITSFYLTATDGKALSSFLPGQYVTVRLNIDGEPYLLNRQYSLTGVPNEEFYRISVKQDATVSNYLHESINIGDTIELTSPAGDFTINLNESNPIHFIAGGVGITPFVSMLHALANNKSERQISLIHATQNENVQAFRNEIENLSGNLPHLRVLHFYSDMVDTQKLSSYQNAGRVTKEALQKLVKDDHDIFFVSGPVPFMKFVINTLYELGVSKENVKYEFFGPSINL